MSGGSGGDVDRKVRTGAGAVDPAQPHREGESPPVAATAAAPPVPPRVRKPQKLADPRELAADIAAKRKTAPYKMLVGCAVIAFVCGAMLVGGVIAMIAIARSLGWHG